MQGAYGIAAFRSRQHVLRTKEILNRHGIAAVVVSTPREISAGCGLSVQFDLKDAERVKSILNNENSRNLIGLYRLESMPGGKQRLQTLSIRQ